MLSERPLPVGLCVLESGDDGAIYVMKLLFTEAAYGVSGSAGAGKRASREPE